MGARVSATADRRSRHKDGSDSDSQERQGGEIHVLSCPNNVSRKEYVDQPAVECREVVKNGQGRSPEVPRKDKLRLDAIKAKKGDSPEKKKKGGCGERGGARGVR